MLSVLCVSCMVVIVKLCGIVQLVLCLFVIRGEMMTALLNIMQGIIFSPRRLRPEPVLFGVCPLCVIFLCSFVFVLFVFFSSLPSPLCTITTTHVFLAIISPLCTFIFCMHHHYAYFMHYLSPDTTKSSL